MQLTIGSTSIKVTSCERLRNNTIGFYLYIKVPKGTISADELYALFDGTTETIVLTKDDGTEESYSGFNAVHNFSVGELDYTFAQACRSELEAQLSLAKNEIAALKKKNAEHEQTISNQGNLLVEYAENAKVMALALAEYEKLTANHTSKFDNLTEQLLITQEELCATYEELELLKATQVETEPAMAEALTESEVV